MKRFNIMMLFIAILVISCTSCKSTFTPKLRGAFETNKIAIDKIQFYNSGRITLEREIKLKEKKARKGAYKKKKQEIQYVERVYRNTPGVCIKEEGDVLYVAFDADNNKYLPFKSKKGHYYLMHNKGKVEYNGATYKITWGRNTYLKIVVDESDSDRERTSKARGRRVSE